MNQKLSVENSKGKWEKGMKEQSKAALGIINM